MVDVRRLHILREVARQGSFAKAATVLQLTPSAVSQQIAALERSLGMPVVERSTRGVQLTEPGRIMVDAADAVASELADAQCRISQLVDGQSGTLNVETFTTGSQLLLPGALSRLLAQLPDICLSVVETELQESIAHVRDGGADLALAFHFDHRHAPDGALTWTPLVSDPLWAVLPEGHRLAGRAAVGLAELADDPWVMGCATTSEVLDRYAAVAGFRPRVVCRSSDYMFAQSMVAAGVGISLVPRLVLAGTHSAAPAVGGTVAVPLRGPAPTRHISAVTARRRWPQPLVRALLQALQDTAAALTATQVPDTGRTTWRGNVSPEPNHGPALEPVEEP